MKVYDVLGHVVVQGLLPATTMTPGRVGVVSLPGVLPSCTYLHLITSAITCLVAFIAHNRKRSSS